MKQIKELKDAEKAAVKELEEEKEKENLEEELEKFNSDISLVGINNRNLNTFEVDFENSIRLAQSLPSGVVKVAESGISNPQNIIELKQKGFDGFLVGENFMKTAEPEIAAKKFIKTIKELENNLKSIAQ